MDTFSFVVVAFFGGVALTSFVCMALVTGNRHPPHYYSHQLPPVIYDAERPLLPSDGRSGLVSVVVIVIVFALLMLLLRMWTQLPP